MQLAAGESTGTGFYQRATRQAGTLSPSPVEAGAAAAAVAGVEQHTATRSLGLRFLAGFAGTAALYALAVWVVNPVGDFEPPIAGAFPLVRSDYRSEKIELFERFTAGGRNPVDGLILGSSRSMLLNGDRMGQAAGGGLRFFNFGLASAKGEDFLAALRHVSRRQGRMPKKVIVGLDVESLRDAKAHGDSTHRLRELATGGVGPWERVRLLAPRVASWSYARDTAYAVYLRVRPRPAAVQFRADGALIYAQRDAARRAGEFSLEQGMAGCMADSRSKIETTRQLSAVQVAYLREAVHEAAEGGARVTVWLTGPHPRTAAHMTEGTEYAKLLAETRSLMANLGAAAIYDFHDSSTYGGNAAGWYDCNHFDDTHARLIERILTGVKN